MKSEERRVKSMATKKGTKYNIIVDIYDELVTLNASL